MQFLVLGSGRKRFEGRPLTSMNLAGEAARPFRQVASVHPGRFVRDVILEPLGLSVTEAAAALGVTRVALSRVLNGQAALSTEMAIRLDKAFGADLETLLRMQSACDIARAKARAPEIDVARYEPA